MIHERGGPSIARWLLQDAAVIAYTELWRELSSAVSYAPWRLSRAWRRPLRTRQNSAFHSEIWVGELMRRVAVGRSVHTRLRTLASTLVFCLPRPLPW